MFIVKKALKEDDYCIIVAIFGRGVRKTLNQFVEKLKYKFNVNQVLSGWQWNSSWNPQCRNCSIECSFVNALSCTPLLSILRCTLPTPAQRGHETNMNPHRDFYTYLGHLQQLWLGVICWCVLRDAWWRCNSSRTSRYRSGVASSYYKKYPLNAISETTLVSYLEASIVWNGI